MNITRACSAGLLDVLVINAPLSPAALNMSFSTPMEKGVTASAFAFGPKCTSMSVAASGPTAEAATTCLAPALGLLDFLPAALAVEERRFFDVFAVAMIFSQSARAKLMVL